MQKLYQKFFGDPNKKVLEGLRKDVEKINAFESIVAQLSDEQLYGKTKEFQDRLAQGETTDDLLCEAFAVVREVAKRQIGQRHFDVQLMGGIVLHRGGIAEMRTGEGKTLTSTCAIYLNALTGKGVHVVTVNDYLARRDTVWMGQIYHALGLTVGCIQHDGAFLYDPEYLLKEGSKEEQKVDEERDTLGSFKVQTDYLHPAEHRSAAYKADITYGTNNEFGFDYLRDNMAPKMEERVMRDELHYAIIDEVDSILIDEARTPLIISAPAEESNKLYVQFAHIIKQLIENEDFNIDEKMRTATLTESGIHKIEKALGIENLYATDAGNLQHYADSALRAKALYQLDVHYVIKDKEIIIVDEFTGRLMPGRRFSEGIHQAIEAKEGVDIKRESQTLATITFQNLFRMYNKLSGMTGTAITEAEEFANTYGLEVTEVPTHLPICRHDLNDRVYKSELGKFKAVIREIKELQEKGQPILVGTVSVEKNELLSELLRREGVKHEILNAKNHAREAEIIAQAGKVGAVTIATNMAGRGVDIVLGGNPCSKEEAEEIKKLGGLHVIGTERHESRRIDNQLRGRSGRQGDPGSTQFYVSMEDDIMRIFGSDRVKGMMDKLGIPDDMPIENKMVSNAIEKAQTRVEGHHFDIRKHLLEYDDVLNKHREVIYGQRRQILEIYREKPEELKDTILGLIENEIEQVVFFHTGESTEIENKKTKGDWDVKEISETLQTIIPLSVEQKTKLSEVTFETSQDKANVAEQRTVIIETIMKIVNEEYQKIEGIFQDAKVLQNIERAVMLHAIDLLWIDHLAAMTALRHGIGLRGYGQRDPLVEYKKESYHMFHSLLGSIDAEIVYSFFKQAKYAVNMKAQQELINKSLLRRIGMQMSGAQKTTGQNPVVRAVQEGEKKERVGRNEPCPCGSGKKYKKCCGAS
ncbi:MAG: Protein translocase subunit SecA [Candidatus Uhrbacteria bacterium GW2011_GWE2_40_58]|nr:MAG: Protein translocase subunit SecA [Candidatus Uhrbacteria bacterium GW2011_GWF2_40_263]KKR67191.1 MAG: Protein translocase subunit SecA [Candidatus Uhrbacteria bacterium GW2011_GWE2_40_58]OGL96614.1 MAG: preprotein translocase subunit SecA [Candidatus Uhrbacteria bacterium RIFOXYB2_FULL_41_18]HBK34599.1 preprotein translocase subunit SecA [Candidatus Uhrbacteria bacterium]HCB55762.1 preprotein translocase subunit SecA [Candidatus Uhrbacteria bacterium]